MTVFDNISYGLRIQRKDKTIIQETVEVVMALMNLVGLNERMPHQLSDGQQQRVALARSLVMQPRVLLFDEPLSNLDAKLREHMRTEIRNLQQRLKITSIYVTHDQTEAMSISDRIVVMNESKIEQVASPIEIYMEPKTIFVADFVGNSNFIKSVVLDTSENHVQVDFFGTPIQVSSNGHNIKQRRLIYIIVRPDAISIQPWSEEESKTYVDGQVKQAEFLGTHIEYEIEIEGGYFISIYDHGSRTPQTMLWEGDRALLNFPMDAFHVLPRDS